MPELRKTSGLADLNIALRLVDSIEQQIAKTQDAHIKRLLLASSCEIIHHVLKAHQPPTNKAA